MSRQNEYQFVDADSSAIEAELISAYENITQRTLKPADPERLFIAWVVSIVVQERVSQNYVGNQNLPSRADGENLDALGEWIYNVKRLSAQASKCTIRFQITTPQASTIVIPQGTRVTDASQTLIWYTTEEAAIEIGKTSVEQMVQCETLGVVGNGFIAGQINTLIDVDNIPYFASCANIDISDGGSEQADDEEYYELMKSGLAAFSTAGPKGAYEYWAKSVSSNIVDVRAIQPRETTSMLIPLYIPPDGGKVAFIGGDYLCPDSLVVYLPSGEKAILGEDYTYNYANELLTVFVKKSSILTIEHNISVEIEKIKAGYVYIYALMGDGTIADTVIKNAIHDTCNEDSIRPLTDIVSCKDAEMIDYDIDLTYYIKRGTDKSAADIQIAVQDAVGQFVAWQHAKIGRDINPSQLDWLLHDTGIKRSVITQPAFVKLRNGDDHTTPQIAHIRNIKVVNGGFEDE